MTDRVTSRRELPAPPGDCVCRRGVEDCSIRVFRPGRTAQCDRSANGPARRSELPLHQSRCIVHRREEKPRREVRREYAGSGVSRPGVSRRKFSFLRRRSLERVPPARQAPSMRAVRRRGHRHPNRQVRFRQPVSFLSLLFPPFLSFPALSPRSHHRHLYAARSSLFPSFVSPVFLSASPEIVQPPRISLSR